MVSRLLLLLCCITFLAAPVLARENGANTATSATLLAEEGVESDDDFDADFDDDFADEFDSDAERPKVLIDDPFEGFNRGTFWVNDKLYFYLFKPVANGYRFVVPRPVRISVNNFFLNLTTPVRAANSLLQFKFLDFGDEVYRLLVNSVIGIGGLFDPAANWDGVKRKEEDFGQTLGYYGFGQGFYLVLPIVGPSSFRDGSGMLVDTLFDPLRYMTIGNYEYMAIHGGKMVNRLALDRDTYEGIIRH